MLRVLIINSMQKQTNSNQTKVHLFFIKRKKKTTFCFKLWIWGRSYTKIYPYTSTKSSCIC